MLNSEHQFVSILNIAFKLRRKNSTSKCIIVYSVLGNINNRIQCFFALTEYIISDSPLRPPSPVPF